VLDPGLFHVLLLALAALATAGLAGVAWRHRDRPGALSFTAAMVGVTVWNLTDVLAMTQTGASHLFWERVQWFAIAVVPSLLFLFMAEFTGYGSYLSRRVVALLFAVPAVSVVLTWTNPAHGLMWTDPELIATGGVVTIDQQFGTWFWLHVAFSYTLLLVGFLLLLRLVVVSDYLYFDQSVLIVLGILAPLVGNALGIFDLTPLPGLDLTTYGFTVTGIAFGNAVFRYRLFELLPATRQLGRQAALAALDDGVVIVGEDREILYFNGAAAEIFDREAAATFGEPLETVLRTEELDFESEDAFAEVSIDDRTYEVTTAPITDQHERLIGHTILLHDVTSRERRERALREQRDELAELDRLNRIMRGVNGALVSATTREEVSRAVCETLVGDGPYDAAWIDTPTDSEAGLLGMTAGDDDTRRCPADSVLPDGVSPPLPGENDDSTELATTQQVSPAGSGGWVTVPLIHRRTVHGALVLGREDGFAEREREVLSELGETIGHAIHAVEQRHLLVADAAVELEFRSRDSGALLVALSEELGPCTLEGLVPDEGGHLLVYVTVSDATAREVRPLLTDGGGIAAVRPVGEDGTATVEVSLSDGSLCCPLVECGANVRSGEAADGTCHLVAEVPPNSDVRSIVDRVTEAYPATQLASKRELPPTEGADRLLPDGEFEDLTERQREVLEAAYRAGYFEWPRDNTAEEVADSLGIASPTLHSHLRKAENRILAEFFDTDE
jgi:PAS domain-containing protein